MISKKSELEKKAVQVVKATKYSSPSLIARSLGIPYDQALEIHQTLEKKGVITAFDGVNRQRLKVDC